MSKITIRSNFRVEVSPRGVGDFGQFHISGQTQSEDDWERDCEEIASQIRRHVDGLPSGRNRGVQVEWDLNHVCSHCGYNWTENSSEYNGGCCAEDEKSAPEEQVA